MPNTTLPTPRDKREAANKRANAAENAGRQAENCFDNLQKIKEEQALKKAQPGFIPKPSPIRPGQGGGPSEGVPPAAPVIIGLAGITVSLKRGNGAGIAIKATNNPTSFRAGGYPQSLVFNSRDGGSASLAGIITGPVGKYTVTVSATNSKGTGSANFFIDVV